MERREFLGSAIAGSAAIAKAAQGNGEIKSAQYVIVELMGHKRLVGRLTDGPAGLLQLDVPVEKGFVTKYINPTAVYAITVVDEKAVLAMARAIDPLPSLALEILPVQRTMSFHDDDRYYGEREEF